MMLRKENDARVALEQLIQDRGEDYASLSRLIGRNAAYIQQFIKRGVPRKLDENDRMILAQYFGVAESMLGAPEEKPKIVGASSSRAARQAADLVLVPYLDVQASAGPGALSVDEEVNAHFAFRSDWLREIADGNPAELSVIRVRGDSMTPTLSDGDDILVDRADAAERLRDGIYVLRVDEMLNVKRIAMNPPGRGFQVRSDNPAYPSWPDCDLMTIAVIGRVIWAGRRIS